MNIQWFPGHMTKSMRMMEESVKLCDGIVYVLDARAPFACVNKNLFDIFADKPIVFALNKADLISKEDAGEIMRAFKSEGKRIAALNGTVKRETDALYAHILDALSEIRERNLKKGLNKILRVMVAGVPNTGKSTIINSLCGEKRAVTGDKSGVTRGKQWIRLKDMDLLDTPGTMPPKFENQYYAKHLAYIGSINDDILDIEELCLEFISEILPSHAAELNAKYSISAEGLSATEVFDEICKKRGFIRRGGIADCERGAKAVLDDFRKGRIDKICLEKKRYEGNDR